MASADLVAVSNKSIRRRRLKRRRQDKPAITARLVLDDHVKSEVGILSEDLFADLFPHLRDSQFAQKRPSQCTEFRQLTSL
jgi:peroxin-6